jgi:hypothetical protein
MEHGVVSNHMVRAFETSNSHLSLRPAIRQCDTFDDYGLQVLTVAFDFLLHIAA